MVFKIHPKALIPLRESYVDIFPLLVFFILFFFALYILFRKRKIEVFRKIVQVISFFLFIYFTQECFCFIRNAVLLGIPLIGKQELLSFGYLNLFVFVICFTLVFGRVFCGWICPFGSLQDLSFLFNKRVPKRMYLPILGLAIIGGIVYFILFSPSQDVLLQFIPNFLALLLLLILVIFTIKPNLSPKLRKIRLFIFFGWIGLLIARVYTFQPWCYLYGAKTGEYGIRLALILIMLSSVLYYRSYCRFICPVGVLLYYCSKLSIFDLRRDSSKIPKWTERVCPLNNIAKDRVVDKGACLLCGRCVEKAGFKIF